MNVNPLLLALPVVFVAAIVVVPVALAALADGLGLHALPQDRRLLLLGCVLRESIHNSISTQWITRQELDESKCIPWRRPAGS